MHFRYFGSNFIYLFLFNWGKGLRKNSSKYLQLISYLWLHFCESIPVCFFLKILNLVWIQKQTAFIYLKLWIAFRKMRMFKGGFSAILKAFYFVAHDLNTLQIIMEMWNSGIALKMSILELHLRKFRLEICVYLNSKISQKSQFIFQYFLTSFQNSQTYRLGDLNN